MTDRLVLLGTAGGVGTALRGSDPPSVVHGPSAAVVVGDRVYLVDAGAGVSQQLTLADPLRRGPRRVLSDLEAVFLTHLHSDHTMDLVNLVLDGYLQGWPAGSVPVLGPWSPDPEAPGERRPRTPGTAELVRRLLSAFEADSVDRERGGARPLRTRMHGVDAVPPDRPATGPSGRWTVHRDDRVEVSATLVPHGTMAPALAYRFDTARWSVVFSGDTAPSDSLVELARGADTLVHEAAHPAVARDIAGDPPYTDVQLERIALVAAKHTPVTEVGRIAARAGVRRLVLSPLGPADLPAHAWTDLVAGFDGELVVGSDLAVLDLP